MPNCVVNGCTPKSREWLTGVILHTFPKDKNMIKKWLEATGQEYADLDKEVEKICESKHNTYRMCSLHFSEDYYLTNPLTGKKKLMPIAVPSIFQPKVSEEKVTEDAFWQAAKRRRYEAEGIASSQFMPGELCPTCRHVIPHVTFLPDLSAARRKFADKGTSFDKSWGTQSKAVQATVRTFSTRIQCNRLRHRKARRSVVSQPFVFTGTAWVRASVPSTPQDNTAQAPEGLSSSEETESTDEMSEEEEEEEEAPGLRHPLGTPRAYLPYSPVETHSSPEEKPSFSTVIIGEDSRAENSSTSAEGVPSHLSYQLVHLLQILSLTLEVIYLLTGEDYKVVKKSGDCVTTRPDRHDSRGRSKRLIHSKETEQKILEFINKIIELLIGETEEHITVKVEETEGDEEYYRGEVPCKEEETEMEIRTDESHRSDKPKPCPSHLHAFTSDGCENNQIDDHITVKVEATEGDEEYYRGGEVPCKEEEIPNNVRTESQRRDTLKSRPSHLHGITLDGCENNQLFEHITVKVEETEGDEVYYRGEVPCKEEETEMEIRTGE